MNLLFIEDEKKKRDFILENRQTKHQVIVGNPATFWKQLQPVSDAWVEQPEVT